MNFFKSIRAQEEINTLINSKPGKRRHIIELSLNTHIHGLEMQKPEQAMFERTIVSSVFFGKELPEMQILSTHCCWYRQLNVKVKSHLVLAHVAGYRKAVFGLPEKQVPILFEYPGRDDILISQLPVNDFVTERYMPFKDWKIVIGRLKNWLENKPGIANINCKPVVLPAYDIDAELPVDIEDITLNSSINWFNNNMLYKDKNKYRRGTGVFEGYISQIMPAGKQALRPKKRSDCCAEGTMFTAMDWAINRNWQSRRETTDILDDLFIGSGLCDNNPESPTYGGLMFYEHLPTYYSEGRAVHAIILASELIEDYTYAKNILRNLMFLLRTTGKNGFRRTLRTPDSFIDKTPDFYANEDFIMYSGHYLGYMWSAFIQAYILTGHYDFFAKAKKAISMYMKKFPDVLWQNGLLGDYSRMMMPLAFLVQVDDTQEHRQWLKQMSSLIVENLVDCGAIREILGDLKNGKYPSPKCNSDYALLEASVIQQNGDPACDLLYTVNFAFAGFHEAAIATGERYYKDIADRLAEFLCKIQIKSIIHPYLNGAWMHSFDYQLWEYYGSSADHAWGPWCVESGWTNSWIAATFGLRKLNRGFLCRKNSGLYSSLMPETIKEAEILQHALADSTNSLKTKVPGSEQ